MLGVSVPTHTAPSKSGWAHSSSPLHLETATTPGGASIRSTRPSISERIVAGVAASRCELVSNSQKGHSTFGLIKTNSNLVKPSLKGLDSRDSEGFAAQNVQLSDKFDGDLSSTLNVPQVSHEDIQGQESQSVAAEDLVHDILAINTLAMHQGKTGMLEEAMELLNGAYSKLNINEHLLTDARLLDQLRAMTLNNMGVTECHRSQPRHALSHFEAARQLEENHDIASPSVALNSCAAYNALGSYEKSTAAALEAIDMLRTLEVQRQQARKIARKKERQLQISQQEGKNILIGASNSGTNIPDPNLAKKSHKGEKEDKDETLLNDVGQLTIAESDNKTLWGAAWHNLAVAQLNTARYAIRKQDAQSERSNTLVIFRNAMKATQDFLGINHPMTKAVVETYRAVRASLRKSGVFKQHRTLLTAPPQPLDPREQELEELLVEPKPGHTRHGTMELNKKELTITFRGDTTSWTKLVERLDPTPYPGAKEEVYQSNKHNRSLQRSRTGANGMINSNALGNIPLSATLIKASQVYGNPHPLLYTPSTALAALDATRSTGDGRNQDNQDAWSEHKISKGRSIAMRQPRPPRWGRDVSDMAMLPQSDCQRDADYECLLPLGNACSKKVSSAATVPSRKAALGRNLELPPKGLTVSPQVAASRSSFKHQSQHFAKSAFPAVMNQSKCIMMALPAISNANAESETITKTTYYAMPTELPGTKGRPTAGTSKEGEVIFPTTQRIHTMGHNQHQTDHEEKVKSVDHKGVSKMSPSHKNVSTTGDADLNPRDTSLSAGLHPTQPVTSSTLPLFSGSEPARDENVAGELFDTMWVAASPAPVDAAAGVTGRLQLCIGGIDALWFDSNGLTHGNRTFSRPEYFLPDSSKERQTQQSESRVFSKDGQDCGSVHDRHAVHTTEKNIREEKPDHGDGMLPMALKTDSSSTTQDARPSKSNGSEDWPANFGSNAN
ncbi:unnamed protein product [Phytomonas sp. EM1]|nr:unnamed protein product [Phytomonas sp. EM1]|eukprot:CCW61109.1 unnamed protein product [Phytomonas sp. isolate EM1]